MRIPDDDEFLALVETAFPKEPIPRRFFHDDLARSSQPDIPEELSNRIEGRCWVDITIFDWTMIGASPVVCRSYLEPKAFIYYLPSLLVGVFHDAAYIDLALEAIIPHNKFHVPRGHWWGVFYDCVSQNQRETLSAFLLRIRRTAGNDLDPTNRALVEHAERVWSGPGE